MPVCELFHMQHQNIPGKILCSIQVADSDFSILVTVPESAKII